MGISNNELNNVTNKVKAMQAKWGLPQRGPIRNPGEKVLASDVNTLVDLVNEGKKKSGWSGTVSNKVNVGDIIRNILVDLGSQADSINSHCPCNCNHCSCNCNNCKCNCNRCRECHSDCDSSAGGGGHS